MNEMQKHQIDFATAQQQTNMAMTELQKTLVKQQQQIEIILRKVYGDQGDEQMDIDSRNLKRSQERTHEGQCQQHQSEDKINKVARVANSTLLHYRNNQRSFIHNQDRR